MFLASLIHDKRTGTDTLQTKLTVNSKSLLPDFERAAKQLFEQLGNSSFTLTINGVPASVSDFKCFKKVLNAV